MYDTGPSVVDEIRYSDDPNLHTGEYLLASGAPILVRPTAPYYYEDAVKEKVVHEVLVPEMLEYWFRNRENGGAFLNARQAYHRGKPIRNILYGNCRQCLRAGGLMQRCHACGIDEAFQAQIVFAMYDIPEVMLDAMFLHRMVGYADNEHDPHIVGLNPDHGISSARPDVTWPIGRHWEELTSFRVDDELDMDLVATIAERNGHPQWEERVQFLKDFRMKRWFYCKRSTIAQIVQQEWIEPG